MVLDLLRSLLEVNICRDQRAQFGEHRIGDMCLIKPQRHTGHTTNIILSSHHPKSLDECYVVMCLFVFHVFCQRVRVCVCKMSLVNSLLISFELCAEGLDP